jgi:hypothetical protein
VKTERPIVATVLARLCLPANRDSMCPTASVPAIRHRVPRPTRSGSSDDWGFYILAASSHLHNVREPKMRWHGTHQVEATMTETHFTNKEAKVLDLLERNQGLVVTRKFLLEKRLGL